MRQPFKAPDGMPGETTTGYLGRVAAAFEEWANTPEYSRDFKVASSCLIGKRWAKHEAAELHRLVNYGERRA